MRADPLNNLEFYESPVSARAYLGQRVTQGEARICELLCEASTSVLEVGCGAGRMYEALGADRPEWVGVDYAETPLRLFAQRHPDAHLEHADATALPFNDGSFGAVLLGYHMIESIMPSARRSRAIAEVARVTTLGGVVVITRHLRRTYHLAEQLLAVLRGQATELGDLAGQARGGSGIGEFRMHVLGEREMSTEARRVGLKRSDRWDYRDGGPVRLRSVSVVEQYRVETGAQR